jgi:preprotein translocase subunit SecA
MFFAEHLLEKGINIFFPKHDKKGYDPQAFSEWLYRKFKIQYSPPSIIDYKELAEDVLDKVRQSFLSKFEQFDKQAFVQFLKFVLLDAIDEKWKEHLYNIESLREGIGLRGYAHLNPKLEYKKEAYLLFGNVIDAIADEVVTTIFNFEVRAVEEEKLAKRWTILEVKKEEFDTEKAVMEMGKKSVASEENVADEEKPMPIVKGEKIGRNDPCPCGSGKKYKKCCLLKVKASSKNS